MSTVPMPDLRSGTRPLLAILAGCTLLPAPVLAQEEGDASSLSALRSEVARQKELIDQQGALLRLQQEQIDELRDRVVGDDVAVSLRGRGLAQSDAPIAPPPMQAAAPLPDQPVGVAPPAPEPRVEVAAVPEGQGVLTPAGTFVFDPSVEYTFASNTRLVFRGIELVPGIQIGLIEASDADRQTLTSTVAFRYGLTNRLEIEGRLPYLVRSDRIEVVQQRDEGITREIRLKENDFGDAEVSLRYQFNRPRGARPVWLGTLRVKSNTGRSPFEIPIDSFGVAQGLATGSGFWGVQPGVSFLLPSDPAVIYGGINYLYHIASDVDRDVGGIRVGRVDPGDSVSANLGFGFALNPRFSYSLGYQHSYIMSTKTEIEGIMQKSNSLQVGRLNLGLSYQANRTTLLNWLFAFGVTSDAPDVSVTLRMPFAR